jgi:hypothetical protein
LTYCGSRVQRREELAIGSEADMMCWVGKLYCGKVIFLSFKKPL